MLIIALAIILFLIFYFITEPDWGLSGSHNPIKRFFYAMEGNWAWLFGGTLITAVLSTLVVLIISCIICNFAHPSIQRESINPIYALEDTKSTYVWRHSHENDIILSYIIEDDIGFAIKSIDAEYAHIKYSNSGEPTIEKYYRFFKPNFLNYIIFPLYEPEYILSVPFDSITNEYNIDLKGD